MFCHPTGQGQDGEDGLERNLPADLESIQGRLAAIESMLLARGDSKLERAGGGEAFYKEGVSTWTKGSWIFLVPGERVVGRSEISMIHSYLLEALNRRLSAV